MKNIAGMLEEKSNLVAAAELTSLSNICTDEKNDEIDKVPLNRKTMLVKEEEMCWEKRLSGV